MSRRKAEDDYAEGLSISMPKALARACDERRDALGYGTLSEYFRALARYDTQKQEQQLHIQIATR